MNILVTGGSGFIGKHLISRLLSAENRVVAFGRNKSHQFSQKENFQNIEGNLVTGEGLQQIPWQEIECVIHLAAAGVKASHREWSECIQVNILGTERLLSWIKKSAVKTPKIFFAKTFYEKLIDRDTSFQKNPYIATKEVSSQLATLWSEDFRGPIIFGTLYHTFGPGNDNSSVLSYAAHQFKENKLALCSSGRALGDWLYIDDTISGILAAIGATEQGAPETTEAPEVYHGVFHWDIGSGNLTTIYDLVERLRIIAGRSSESVIFDPSLDRTNIIFQEAAQQLPPNFIPRLTLQQGLEKLYRSL